MPGLGAGPALGEGEWPSFDGIEATALRGKVQPTYGLSLSLSSIFRYDSEVLLWVTLTGVCGANLHLYYRFREGYGDRRLVEEAPGHFFLDYEKADLESYIQICLLNGWDIWVLGSHDYARLFVSHDNFFDAAVVDEESRKLLFE